MRPCACKQAGSYKASFLAPLRRNNKFYVPGLTMETKTNHWLLRPFLSTALAAESPLGKNMEIVKFIQLYI